MRINKIYLLWDIRCVVDNDNDISNNMTLINGCISCVDNNESMVSGHTSLSFMNSSEENSSFDADINRYGYH